MKLKKLSDLVYYLPHEEKRDRPLLSYINGTKIKLAIDAGSSLEHVKLFYKELKDHNLELPDLTILTHWHWDHTFGVHAINGLSITSKKTYQYLAAEQKQILKEEYIKQLHSDLHGFKEEYENKTINIKLPDIQYQEELVLDLGGISAFIKEVEAPHSLDSTIVYIKEEELLFLGDCVCEDVFNDYYLDKEKLRSLIKTIEGYKVHTCILSHETPIAKEQLLKELKESLI